MEIRLVEWFVENYLLVCKTRQIQFCQFGIFVVDAADMMCKFKKFVCFCPKLQKYIFICYDKLLFERHSFML